MKRKSILLPWLLLGLLLSLPTLMVGCWDKREPNLLGVVTIAAYDFDSQTGLLKVIAQVANPLGISGGENGGGGGSGSGEKSFWVVEASGHTIYETIKKMEQVTSRKLLWSHLEVVLFSEALARKGLRPVLDYIDRERQARLIARPFVVQGDVRQLLETEFPLQQLSGPALIRQLLTLRMEDAVVPEIDTLRLLFHSLSLPGVELLLPSLEVQVEKKEAGGEKNGGSGSNGENKGGGGSAQTGMPPPAKISGAALFRGDKLIGFFDEKETAGYLWLTGNIHRLTMVFSPPGEQDKYLTIEIFRAVSKLESQVRGEQVRWRLFIYAEGRLQDFGGLSLPLDEGFKSSLNRRMATVIHNQIGRAWQKAQALNVDVFGCGCNLYRNRPRDWRRLEGKWAEIFPENELEADVHTLIHDYGLVTEPLQIR